MSGDTTSDPRERIRRALERGATLEVCAAIRDLLGAIPTMAEVSGVMRDISPHAERLGLRTVRVWLARSCTVAPVIPFLRAGALAAGLMLDVRQGDHDAYIHELLETDGARSTFEPDVIVVAAFARDMVPDLWSAVTVESQRAQVGLLRDRLVTLERAVEVVRTRTSAAVVIQTLDGPWPMRDGVGEWQRADAVARAIERLNEGLVERAGRLAGVYVFDYAAVAASHGRARWYDDTRWHAYRSPWTADAAGVYGSALARVIAALFRAPRKAIVVDLDNTLWGGVIGEDGVNGLQVGSEYPGSAYRNFQRFLSELRARGILLAIVSKNDRAEALAALDGHPGMVLRSSDFSAIEISWQSKAAALRNIAVRLKLGTDALVFVDDSAYERAHVRAELPDVLVVDLPPEPARFVDAVVAAGAFDGFEVTSEDRQRAAYYDAEQRRASLQAQTKDTEVFLLSLGTWCRVADADARTVARVAQLTQKTNQFTVTTRRCSETEILERLRDPDWTILTAHVGDRFGDSGLTGVLMMRRATRERWEIDTLLVSCRVIGRGIETALLATAAERTRADGARFLDGRFIPTSRNEPAATCFRDHGFQRADDDGPASVWRLDLLETKIPWPAHVGRETGMETAAHG